MAGKVYIALASFSYVNDDGEPAILQGGQRVREGHPVMRGREDLFKEDDTRILEWEAPTERLKVAPEATELKRSPGRPPKPKPE